MKHPFIVIEGLDGSGKATQKSAVQSFGTKANKISSPYVS